MRALLEDLETVRERTLGLVSHLTPEDLERQTSPLMSPLVWDLGHIAAYEDLWLNHRLGGRPLLHPELAAAYDAFETPRAVRGDIELLDDEGARAYLAEVRERTRESMARTGRDPVLHELVLRHELQHTETMRQAMRLAGMEAPGDAERPGPLPSAGAESDPWVHLVGGRVEVGTDGGDGEFSYDNERPRHRVRLPSFAIARRPVDCASWLTFTEGGGYERREWWSREGWAWKMEYDIGDCPAARAADPSAPVCCVSWFEADAFARSRGARLPTEHEWEHAMHRGVLEGTGAVWEWTGSPFTGYPGFRAHPYREYSEVFFGDAYRVLRGGSWATHPRLATTTFRNWDLPERRQVFSGVRLAC